MKTQDIKNIGQAWMQVQENQKAALQKKLAKSAQSSEKGKKAVTLPKAPFHIPEDVPVDERDMFIAKAAAAHKAGKSHFDMNGKKHPVTMKKDTAKAVNSSTNEMSSKEKMKKGLYNSTTEEMDETKPCPKCDGSMENHEPDCPMNPKNKAGNDKEVAVANPKQEKAKATVEGTVYARILEKASHKDGTPPEGMHDKSKSSKGAMDMLNTPKEVKDNPEASGDDVKKAGAAGPKAKARPNDNMKGDKNIINPPKEAK